MTQADDGERLIYLFDKPRPDGSWQVTLTPLELLDRLARFIPPPRRHLHRYHGVFAPHAALRAKVTARAGEAIAAPVAPSIGQSATSAPVAPDAPAVGEQAAGERLRSGRDWHHRRREGQTHRPTDGTSENSDTNSRGGPTSKRAVLR
ncbi:MAG: transposase [Xanthomonadales bacterium]|nr:transposase [Xanthomonadales bacterium]